MVKWWMVTNMALIKSNSKERLVKGLLNASYDDETIERLTTLQNEIGISFSTKVVAITSIKHDELAVAFAKAFASAYSANGAKTLVIDANLYNPLLSRLLSDLEGETENGYRTLIIDGQTTAICLPKEIYPSEVYKSGLVQKIISENEREYDHFVVVVPEIKDHKEIVLLKDVVTSIILLTQKDVTKKEHIYNAIQYCAINKLPLAKTMVLK